MDYRPFCSTEIVFSDRPGLEKRILSLEAASVVLLMSGSSAARWDMMAMTAEMGDRCASRGGAFTWIREITPNPTQRDIIEALKRIGDNAVELVIAIGGGSCMDLAKGIRAFHDPRRNSRYAIDEITGAIKEKKPVEANPMEIIAVPSTAGTGSEVTQWATIWDENKTGKFSIDHPALKPKLAIIVPELTVSLPAEMTLSTGLDAMCQAIEAYWSRHTTPVVQEIAYRAVELVMENLRRAVDDPGNLDAREMLCRGSVLAGLAFSHTRTTACHSISYPLTISHGVPHGLAASITLDAVARINRGAFPNDARLFGLFEKYGGIMNWIDTTSRGVVTMRLSAFGIGAEDIPSIAAKAFTLGRMDNNPVNLTETDVTGILTDIL